MNSKQIKMHTTQLRLWCAFGFPTELSILLHYSNYLIRWRWFCLFVLLTPSPECELLEGRVYAILCHGFLAPHSNMQPKLVSGGGTKVRAIRTGIPLKARALLSLSHGGEDPADTLSTCKRNQSQSPGHTSVPKDDSSNVTPFPSTTHTKNG